MKIDVSDLLKSVGAELKIKVSEEFKFKEDELKLSSPVSVDLKLVNTGSSILVTGGIKAKVKLCCCRCLKEFDLPVSLKIEEEYVKKAASAKKPLKKDEEIELKDEDLVFEIDEKNFIDLDEAVRQNIIVALPIKPLCSKTCKVQGLAKPGKKPVDPRLAKLASFKSAGGK